MISTERENAERQKQELLTDLHQILLGNSGEPREYPLALFWDYKLSEFTFMRKNS